MRLLKIACTGLLCFLLLILNQTKAQKKWDGEAGDGLWGSERNWYPDGVPDSSMTVILDNTVIAAPYTIMINSDTNTIKLHALIIQPSHGGSIMLEIPIANKAAPALSLLSNKLSITISEGGTLINRSSAVAGNTILMNGKIRIEDGGRYSHQTIRGNAYIITRLEALPGTEQGVVEFDVPGNATYPLSVSGRQYGSLWLNASNKQKRTYTGSGNNDLLIRGDLKIDDSVSVHSSLTGNISIGNNFMNRGSLSINPATADSFNRELVFSGIDSEYFSGGKLDLGEHFNAVRLKKGNLYLRSSIQLDRIDAAFIVDPWTRLMMDTFCVNGNGQFKTDCNAVIGIASPDGISMDPSKGNIRTTRKDFDPTTSFIFYGDHEQVTGTSFPSSISSLAINKAKGGLRLSSPLVINDSLTLSKGIIYTSTADSLQLFGVIAEKEINQYGWPIGNDSSFIDGPLRVKSNNAVNTYFPVGKNRAFAPIKIDLSNKRNKIIEVEYFESLKADQKNIVPPLKSLIPKGYWKINTVNDRDTLNEQVSLQLAAKPPHNNLLNSLVIAMADSTTSNWNIIQNSSYDLAANIWSGTMALKPSVLTLGNTQEEILSQKRIDLTYRKDLDAVMLIWVVKGDTHFKDMCIEKSKDGITYNIAVRHEVSPHESHHHPYEKKIILDDSRENYFRVVCRDEADTRLISNIVCVINQKNIEHPFPNPADAEVMIRVPDHVEKRKLIVEMIDNAGRKIPINMSVHGNVLRINTSNMNKGLYRVQVQFDRERRSYSFMKN